MSKALKNIYKPIKATLESIIDESPLIKTLVLIPEEEFSFETGQFVELTLNGEGEAPFTPSSSPFVKDKIEITIMKAGYVTEKMHNLKPGTVLGIRGPFGSKYPYEEFFGKEVVILGGGCGLAPLRSLIYTLIEYKDKIKKLHLLYGSKTPKDCIYKPYFSELQKIPNFETMRSVDKVDEPWEETEGLVTVLLDKIKIDIPNSVAVVCGPPIMMKFGTLKLVDMGFPDDKIFLSMEKNMSCGLGKCGHCMMGDLFVCKEGPVFNYAKIKNYPNIWH